MRVHPRASRARIEMIGETLHVWVQSPAAEGAANRELLRLVADWAGVSRMAVSLVRGERSRDKLVEFDL
ncbi:MAG: DUF167 domain-containing protein [Candidatus Dormibacteria bacterium]